MKYSEIIEKYNLTVEQKMELLPIRRCRPAHVIVRQTWLSSLENIDNFKLCSRVLLALIARLSCLKYRPVYIDEIREEIGAKKMAVERAMHTLLDRKIILKEANEINGGRLKYYKFNPDFEDFDAEDIMDMISTVSEESEE